MFKMFNRLRDDASGSMLIETAFIAPTLILMTLAGVEVSSMVARQTELQTIAANAVEIILAAAPSDDTETAETLQDVKDYISSTSNLTITTGDPQPGQVSIYKRWRCGNNSERQATSGCANDAQTLSTYLIINMKETYSPIWTDYGIGDNLTFSVKRSVQIG